MRRSRGFEPLPHYPLRGVPLKLPRSPSAPNTFVIRLPKGKIIPRILPYWPPEVLMREGIRPFHYLLDATDHPQIIIGNPVTIQQLLDGQDEDRERERRDGFAIYGHEVRTGRAKVEKWLKGLGW